MSVPAQHARTTTLWLLAGGGLLLFLFNTWAIPLSDPDEGRYAEIGREMMESRDWVVPHLFDLPYLEKPPLLYWLTAISLKLFGLNEFAVRLAPAFAAATGLLLTGLFAHRLFGLRVGAFSMVILATSLLYFIMARSVITDMLFSVLVAGALMAYWLTQKGHLAERAGFFALWMFVALATLTKGPTGAVICGAVIFLDLLSARSLKTLARRQFWCGLPVFVLLTVPWFILVEQRHPGYLDFYLIKEHLQRAGGAEHGQPVYWFAPILLAGLLPWTFIAVAAAPAWLKAVRTDQGDSIRFLLLWTAVVFGLFSAAGGKLIPYILPLFPALAILIAWHVDRRLSSAAPPPRHRWLVAGLTALALVLLAAGVQVVLPSKAIGVRLPLPMLLGLAVPLLTAAIFALSEWRRPCLTAPSGIALGMALFYVGLTLAMPAVCDQIMASPLIRRARAEAGPHDEVALVNVHLPGTAFYFRHIPFLVGGKGELSLGFTLAGAGAPQRFLSGIAELKTRPPHRRVLLLTRPAAKRDENANAQLSALAEDLRREGGSLTKLAANRKIELWLLTRSGRK